MQQGWRPRDSGRGGALSLKAVVLCASRLGFNFISFVTVSPILAPDSRVPAAAYSNLLRGYARPMSVSLFQGPPARGFFSLAIQSFRVTIRPHSALGRLAPLVEAQQVPRSSSPSFIGLRVFRVSGFGWSHPRCCVHELHEPTAQSAGQRASASGALLSPIGPHCTLGGLCTRSEPRPLAAAPPGPTVSPAGGRGLAIRDCGPLPRQPDPE